MPLARHDVSNQRFPVVVKVSTHMPLARHDNYQRFPKCRMKVSTHMPLARHDPGTRRFFNDNRRFYSHASCEAWPTVRLCEGRFSTFLLTCLLRGMTIHRFIQRFWHRFYSHASCEAWRKNTTRWRHLKVSTHMPLARHDKLLFNYHSFDLVSTHMPLARHDHATGLFGNRLFSFYSHASCEAWRWQHHLYEWCTEFLLTCLLRGMT